MKGGETLAADLIVLATGYKGQQHLVRKLFGDEIADRVGPIWGFGEDQELRNMYTRTGQPGLWFIAGSLAQCGSTRNIWRCRSRRSRRGCCRVARERQPSTTRPSRELHHVIPRRTNWRV